MKFILDRLFEKTQGFYPFFEKCPKKYWEYYLAKRAYNTLDYKYNWHNPRTLNEKIRWLIYNEKLELKSKLTDKILVKSYVANKLGKNHSAELYGIYNDIDEIDCSMLPDSFALKANHGWRMNILVKNKKTFIKEYKNIKKITRNWLKINYENFSLEPQYKDIKRKLFIEYLRPVDFNGEIRNDIQVWCFNGTALYVEHNSNFYNTKWEKQKFGYKIAPYNEEARPERLDEIIEMAQKLAQGFDFVRVDFAIDGSDIHVLEMTFTPGSAIIPFADIKYDLELGEMLNLSSNGVCYGGK